MEHITVRGAMDFYCEHHSIDLVATMTKKYSFWANLFHSSVTESLAWNSSYPLLVLHRKY